MDHERLTRTIIGRAMTVHDALGPGFLEPVYQKALAYELRDAGLAVEREHRVQVHYRGQLVGDYWIDLLVERCVLVELKAVRTLAPAHDDQLYNYLAATKLEVGLLLNFGARRLEFRRRTREYARRGCRTTGK
jgi:GxxExxY protein